MPINFESIKTSEQLTKALGFNTILNEDAGIHRGCPRYGRQETTRLIGYVDYCEYCKNKCELAETNYRINREDKSIFERQ